MTPNTKQEALRLIDELKAKIGELPDGGRPVTEGWEVKCREDAAIYRADPVHGVPTLVARIEGRGLYVANFSEPALDGIAHDDKGRIKVVGYVCAEELMAKIRSHHTERYLREGKVMHIIDELAG